MVVFAKTELNPFILSKINLGYLPISWKRIKIFKEHIGTLENV